MIVYGTVEKRFEPVREAFANAQANDPGGAQLCIYRTGEIVVDLWTAERGLLDVERPSPNTGRNSLRTAKRI